MFNIYKNIVIKYFLNTYNITIVIILNNLK
jgi:hypothetical protein